MMPRRLHIAEKSNGRRTNSMASNSITSQSASTRWPTRLQMRHPAESWCRQVSSPATSISPWFAVRSQNRAVKIYPILAWGLNNHRLHPALKSWSSKRIQRQSPTLWSTGEWSTSITSSVTHCRQIGQRPDGSRVVPSPLFLWRANSTSEATPGSCSATSPSNRGSVC